MSVPSTIADKLRNYEYEKRGCGDAVGDIYALIHYIDILEKEVDDLKEAAVPRTMEGDGSDLPFGSVVIDCDGDVWQHDWVDGWSLTLAMTACFAVISVIIWIITATWRAIIGG